MRTTTVIFSLLIILFFRCQTDKKESTRETKTENLRSNNYQDLVALFKEWRTFETPPKLKGAPDYRKATFTQRMPTFNQLRARLKYTVHNCVNFKGF